MKARISAALLLIPLALVLAASTQVTVTFTNPPASIDGATLYLYDSGGKLAAKATVSGSSATFTIDNSADYLAKLDANGLYALFVFPSGATSHTFNFSESVAINATYKAVGGFIYEPKGPIEYTAALTVGGVLTNATFSTAKTLYASPGVKVWLPEKLLFPGLYGFKLANITLNGAPVQNGFTIASAGTYTIEATYEFAGMPMWAYIGIAAFAVLLVAALAARGRSRTAMALARASEWLED